MKVSIDKTELLAIVRSNYEKHKAIVDEAQAKFRELAIAELESMLSDAKNGKTFRRALSLPVPLDQSKEYRKAIRQLELSQNNSVEMSEVEFDQLVMDNWAWKSAFMVSNSGYSKAAEDYLEN